MKIIEKSEGPKIPYEESGTWLNFDDQIMMNLKKSEADYDVHIDISSDVFGHLTNGVSDYYVAQIDIPARQYTETEVDNPDYDDQDETSQKTITNREPVPFSMDNVTLTLFALKEGVFNE
jgi:hypothetical protein